MTARVLARHPEGLLHLDLFKEVLQHPLGDFHEVTGAAGDVVLGHPFLFHTRGFKHVGEPRFISNTECGLTDKMDFSRVSDADISPLERSIRIAVSSPTTVPQGAMACRF
jgi:hypothetical protein